MILTLPTFTDPFYTQYIDLSGRGYLFDFRFNQRCNVWYFDIALDDGTPLANGIKVVPGVPLLTRFADRRLPPGILYALNTSSADDSPPGVLELGATERVQLTYVTTDELT